MLRKHINSLNNEELKEVPFYSWDCITLCLHNRDVDLVIRNEEDMENIIKLLVYKLKTMDGSKGSAVKMINYLQTQKF